MAVRYREPTMRGEWPPRHLAEECIKVVSRAGGRTATALGTSKVRVRSCSPAPDALLPRRTRPAPTASAYCDRGKAARTASWGAEAVRAQQYTEA
jgi:hypothetical protein